MQKVKIVTSTNRPNLVSLTYSGRFSFPKLDSSAVGIRVLARATYATAKPKSEIKMKIATIWENFLPYEMYANSSYVYFPVI